VVSAAVLNGVPVPAFSTALAYYDGYRATACPRTCCRHSATTSARTPTSASTGRAGVLPHQLDGRGGTTSASTYSV